MEVSGHADIIPSPEHRPLIPSWSGVRTLELQGNQVILSVCFLDYCDGPNLVSNMRTVLFKKSIPAQTPTCSAVTVTIY